MRLFGKVTGTINRFDRAEWMTAPFDGAATISSTLMRLFGKVDRSINYNDRAEWMTPPFNKDLRGQGKGYSSVSVGLAHTTTTGIVTSTVKVKDSQDGI